MELWPGYFTSVNPNERGTVLIADVTHKVLRTDTVLDYLRDLGQVYNYPSSGAHAHIFREVATKNLQNQIVLTRYNNRTYRIDDIQWDKTPMRYVSHCHSFSVSVRHNMIIIITIAMIMMTQLQDTTPNDWCDTKT